MDNPDTPAAPEAPAADDSPEALKARLTAAEAKATESWDRMLRATAELDNIRRRNEREMDSFRKYASERLLGDLLAVADSLDMGLSAAEAPAAELKAVVDGTRLTQKQLLQVLDKHGVKIVDPQGQVFDPDQHEAVAMVPSAQVAPQHVVSVMQKGYRLHDRVLRPARVVVAKAPDA